MSVLVVGSVAYDNIHTPKASRERVLGGAATHFSAAASFFTQVFVVGVVGSDFDDAHAQVLSDMGVDLTGLQVIKGGKTFSWSGKYLDNMNDRETLDTKLGVFGDFDPVLSKEHSEVPILFLANIHPSLQLKVLDQMKGPKLVAMDTMNLWINTTREELQKVIERVDMVFVNDEEAKMLSGEKVPALAAKKIMEWGPKVVVVKRGEHGALLFTKHATFFAPAFPHVHVVDPTGAGDTFAGGFIGYLSKAGDITEDNLRRAAVCGGVMASFQVEDFGLDRLCRLNAIQIEERFKKFIDLSLFDTKPLELE